MSMRVSNIYGDMLVNTRKMDNAAAAAKHKQTHALHEQHTKLTGVALKKHLRQLRFHQRSHPLAHTKRSSAAYAGADIGAPPSSLSKKSFTVGTRISIKPPAERSPGPAAYHMTPHQLNATKYRATAQSLYGRHDATGAQVLSSRQECLVSTIYDATPSHKLVEPSVTGLAWHTPKKKTKQTKGEIEAAAAAAAAAGAANTPARAKADPNFSKRSLRAARMGSDAPTVKARTDSNLHPPELSHAERVAERRRQHERKLRNCDLQRHTVPALRTAKPVRCRAALGDDVANVVDRLTRGGTANANRRELRAYRRQLCMIEDLRTPPLLQHSLRTTPVTPNKTESDVTPGPADYQGFLGCRRDYTKGASILHKHPLPYASMVDAPGPGTYKMTSKATMCDVVPITMGHKWRRTSPASPTPGPGEYHSPALSRRRPTATKNVRTPVLSVTGKEATPSCMLSETKRLQREFSGVSQTSANVQQVLYADTLAASEAAAKAASAAKPAAATSAAAPPPAAAAVAAAAAPASQ